MKKTETAPRSGSIELRENRSDCVILGALGFVGILPLTVWASAIILALPDSSSTGGSTWQDTPLSMAIGIVLVIAMFAIPIAVPISILRRRQKNGARITWDEDGVVEWDGAWKRNAISWSRMDAAHLVWEIRGRGGSRTPQDVLQLFDRSSAAVISAWQSAPAGTPVVRRRVIASDLAEFVEMLRIRKISFSQKVDYARAEDPDRHRMKGWELAIARLGYVGAVMGPMVALPSPIPGAIVSVIAAALLAWRAMPAMRELRIVSARIRGAGAVVENESDKTDPYREASAPPVAIDLDGRMQADRTKRHAVVAEVALRSSFVALTLFAGVANALHPN